MSEYRERLLSLLGSDDAFIVLADTPTRVADLVGRIGEEGLSRRFAPGKWSAREVFAHLTDVEQATGFRIRQVVTSPPGHVIQPFDQALWARPYMGLPTRVGIRAFVSLRMWNLFYYRSLSAEDRAKVGFHPERGEESVETILRMQAGHDRNHLEQLETIAAMPAPEEAAEPELNFDIRLEE
jgi:hypothetical protein